MDPIQVRTDCIILVVIWVNLSKKTRLIVADPDPLIFYWVVVLRDWTI